ncbi:MAG: MTH1187 family thiamine-binding protein [Thermoplasmata archaeon]
MLAEFTIVPLDKGESLSGYVSEILEIVDSSGLEYRLTPMGTIVEGDWDEVMSLVKGCHMHMRGYSKRVSTSVKVDDREGAVDRLEGKVRSVESKLGKKLKK